MEPLYDSLGQARYFLADNGRIISANGQSAAWIDKRGNVYDYVGNHLGRFEDGHIRGNDGGVMLWQKSAKNLGVVAPVPLVPPVPPVPSVEPVRPVSLVPPVPAARSLSWSRITF